VLVPLLLICGAAGSAAVVAYGANAGWAEYAHGIQMICLCRRIEWPMVALSLLFCAALLVLTISGRYRVWWLMGLGPVLALFVRGFSSAYHPAIALLDSPQFVDAQPAVIRSLADSYIVGLFFDQKPYALPYSALANSPLVLLSGFDKRALVIWSMTANCATVLPLDRDTRPREIEVVSRPADSLLLFDARLGQFIVGVTGLTVGGDRPVGFGVPLAVEKVPASVWITQHPETLVMTVGANGVTTAAAPVLPLFHFPQQPGNIDGDARIAILATTQPTAVMSDVAMDQPCEIQAGATSVLLDRDPKTRALQAYDRHLKEDFFLTFKPLKHPARKHPDAVLVDSDSESLWTIDGRAVDGPLKGQRLHPISVDDGLYWGVMRFWIPALKLVKPQ
jgi:hypothetical protein